MPRVVNLHRDPYTHYIGRPSELSNPYSHRASKYNVIKMATAEEACESFERYARDSFEVLSAIFALPEDAVLGCFCKPKICHGDVIIKLWKELHNK